jgi:hypothetical protein
MSNPRQKQIEAAKDMTGLEVGLWFVSHRLPPIGGGARWECICRCGTVRSIRGVALRRGESLSCGCRKIKHKTTEARRAARREQVSRYWSKHPERRKELHRLFYRKHRERLYAARLKLNQSPTRRAYQRRYRENNREHINATVRAWHERQRNSIRKSDWSLIASTRGESK